MKAGAGTVVFPPMVEAEAKLHLEQHLSQGQKRPPGESRWKLATLLEACGQLLGIRSQSGLWLLMRHLGVTYQKARSHVHSPDDLYEPKLEHILKVITRYQMGKVAVLFEDELTYYNHASPAADYAPQYQQPKAERAIGGERSWRAIAALDAFSGTVISDQGSKISIPKLIRFLEKIRQAYPQEEVIYIILDNWPIHFHPDVLSALVEQQYPFPYHLPKSWHGLQASGKYKHLQLPIQLVGLPTYASWLNPAEKIWRAVKQQRIHNHSYANNFKELINQVDTFLLDLAKPSRKTLSLAGLLKPSGIFADALARAGMIIDSS